MESWSEFNVAIAGASAALAGLIIVALSVNIAEIIKAPTLTSRAAASIAALVLTVVATGIGLIPYQPYWVIGLELVIPVLLAAGLEAAAIARITTAPAPSGSSRFSKIIVGIVPLAGFAVGTIMLLMNLPGGFYAIAAGSLTALVAAVVYAWVALVEVLR
jgi:modulator of FtsH protease